MRNGSADAGASSINCHHRKHFPKMHFLTKTTSIDTSKSISMPILLTVEQPTPDQGEALNALVSPSNSHSAAGRIFMFIAPGRSYGNHSSE